MDRRDSSLSAQAIAILRMIADGRSYDQILLRHPRLTYQDIFAAAQEALSKLDAGQADGAGPEQSETPSETLVAQQHPVAPPSGAVGARLPSFIERARQTHHRAWARWTPDEDEQLERLFRRGAHLAEIGQALGRHNGAIRSRLAKLGLLPDDIEDPDELLTRGGRRSTLSEGPDLPAHVASPPPTPPPTPPPRSSFGWDTIRRRLEGSGQRDNQRE